MLTKISKQVRVAVAHFRKLSVGQLAMVMICVVCVAGGGAGQLIALNLWIDAFPGGGGSDEHHHHSTESSSLTSMSSAMWSHSGNGGSSSNDMSTSDYPDSSSMTGQGAALINPPFAILTLGAVTQAVVYMSFFGVYVLVKSPRLSFLCTWKSVYLSAAIGFSVAINGVLLVCATGNTPELLQAFLLSTIVLWTFLFVKVIFAEKRSYVSPLVLLSFAFSLAGIIVGSAGSLKSAGMDANTICWTLLFAVGMIPGALNAVISAKYMRHFEQPEGVEYALAGELALLDIDEREELLVLSKETTDANTSKYAMLVFGNLWQSFFMFFLMPLGALPWFGVSANMSDLLTGVANGYKCTFNHLDGCDDVWKFFVLFNVAFICSGIGSMFLNYYSPAINSMVGQLSAPLSALVLLIAPAWNPHQHKGRKDLGFNIGAIFLIVSGSIIYTIWEESTRNKSAGKHSPSGRSLRSDEDEEEDDCEEKNYGTQYNAARV